MATQKLTQITDGQVGVSSPLWSPSGDTIAFLGRVPSIPAPWRPVPFDDSSDLPKVITRAQYKFDGLGWFDQARNQVFVVALDGAAPRQLTMEPTGVFHPTWTSERGVPLGSLAWSHDGHRLAFVMSTDEDEARDGRCDIWTVAIDSGQLTRISPNDGLYGCPAWSPDDEYLAFAGTRLPKKGGANANLWRASASGSDTTRQLNVADICVGSGLMSDSGAPGAAQVVWLDDGIYFGAGERGSVQLWRVPETGGQPQAVTRAQQALGSWAVDQSGTTLAYCATSPTSPGEVFSQTLSTSGGEGRQLTRLNADLLSGVWVGEPEEFHTQASDGSGTDIHGWILKPPGFSTEKRYPVILEIHGGPHVGYGWSWFHEFACYASQGYVIVFCNPRGSSGYGEDFATSIYLDWGTKPMVDVMSALDYVLAQGFADPDRLYVTGGSYGGYMVDWIVTHTDRFRAAAGGRCVSDLQTLALASDNGTVWMAEYFGGMPWEEPEVYRFGSPITHVANCRTPLFIEHQEMDQRCTMDQAEQMYNALRFLGVETEMVLYPKEPHGMSRDGQPRHRVDRLIRTMDWFQRHGGTDPASQNDHL